VVRLRSRTGARLMSSAKKLLEAAAGTAAGGGGLDVSEVFSTFLYTGTGTNAAQTTVTVNNGIDLSGEGGLVWAKARTNPGTGSNGSYYSSGADGAGANMITDSENGLQKQLSTNNTREAVNFGTAGPVFSNSGFAVGYNGYTDWNYDGYKYASWTFRKAEKFFDIQTWTGNGASGRLIDHNLGSAPGMVAIKCTSTNGTYWSVYHRGLTNPTTSYVLLNLNAAEAASGFTRTVNSTQYELGPNWDDENKNGRTYVAYFFAHNAGDGEFGPDGDQDIISCGSYTGNGSGNGPVINLGWEPQWLMVKAISAGTTWDWLIWDVMRGLPSGVPNSSASLNPNWPVVESLEYGTNISATGFQIADNNSEINQSNKKYIYMAIRAPMIKEPEAATEVFGISTNGQAGDSKAPAYRSTFPVDMYFEKSTGGSPGYISNRLTGKNYMQTNATNAVAADNNLLWSFNNGVYNTTGSSSAYYGTMWKRAKGYFDVVAWAGNSSYPRNIAHSLGVVPEMMWVKARNAADNWRVYSKDMEVQQEMLVNGTYAASATGSWGTGGRPTASVFITGSANTNYSGRNYIAYLFATLAGISKVGLVAHSGSSTDVNCGFSNGAKFVILKRKDATGDWYYWDSARGIVAGNDPYLLLNTTAAQVTNTDYIDPLSSGFQISGDFTDGTYIFYAVAT